MRRRSNTVYAQNLDDFNSIADGQLAAENSQNFYKPRSGAKRIRSASAMSELLLENPNLPSGDDFWSEFEYGCGANSTTLRKESSVHSQASTNENGDEISLEAPTSTIVKKIMVIGQKGSGKHFIVNSAFHSEDSQNSLSIQQTMDFMLKTEAEGSLETKYHFWIRSLNEHKFDTLIKVYYKIISVFVFVYSTADRSSFEALDEAIESVRKEVSREKFVGVLLANTNENEMAQVVSHADGLALKEKFNLEFFMDSSEGEGNVREKLLEVLNKNN